MDETPFYRRPWFYIFSWLVFLLIVYGWQIYRMGGVQSNWFDILIDLVIIFPLFLVIWMAFFAQFVLPVRTFQERQKIFDRLVTHLFGGHGPALFIENGIIKEHSGERLKRGPGVLWLDSASAAVTRTATAIRQVLGPGVHFINGNEFVAGTVDLHIQSHSVGPKEMDQPFAEKSEEEADESYRLMQDRRKQVSALTRDGIEIIPNITVTFRVDTGFPEGGQSGSRFGYRKGLRKKDREDEEKDKEAIRNAILGEAVNPMVERESPRHRVAWNQLPASLAVDIWREYAAKFTMDELFAATQTVPAPPPPTLQPTESEIAPLSHPIQVGSRRENFEGALTSMLRQVNGFMERSLQLLEGKTPEKARQPIPPPAPSPQMSAPRSEPQKKTALQVINEMVKARLTQPEVDILDDHGVRGEGKIASQEYMILKKRGLKVLNVSIGNLRFNPVIEQTIISRWSTTWLKNAKAESEQIERRRNVIQSAGHERAIRQYADMLSRDLIQKKPEGVKGTLKTLLMRTRAIIINNDQLRQRMQEEQQDLEEIIKWVEESES